MSASATSQNCTAKAAIVLGAGKFIKSPALDRAGFSRSATSFVSYLLDENMFALPTENLLNLFDSKFSPGDQLERMCEFLDAQLRQATREGKDILFYYVGHGGFVGVNKEYFLTIASTKEGLEGSTGIRIGDLSSCLRDHARQARKYLILDCCFAASAFSEFQDPGLSDVISAQTLEPLPPSGTALLCSSGSRQVSLSPHDQSLTMFSGALMEILRSGEVSGQAAFSLDEVGRKVKDLLRSRYPQEWTRPEVHSPDMREGDVADIPIFPNPRFSPDLAFVPRIGSGVWASMDRYLEVALEAVGDALQLGGVQLGEAGQRARDMLKAKYPQDWTMPTLPPRASSLRKPDLATSSPAEERDYITNQALLAKLSLTERSYDATLEALGDALDLKNAEPPSHSKRVTAFTIAIARGIGIPTEEIKSISRAAFLHDIGNIAVPDAILRKPGTLTPEEIAIMQKHCYDGYWMLKKIPFLKEAAEVVYAHHERYDGTGYPRGLSGEQIPLGARVFSVADTLDAITSDRTYRPAQSMTAAREEIERWSGRQFDPGVAKTFLSMPENIWPDLCKEIDAMMHRVAYTAENEGGRGTNQPQSS